MTSTGSEHRQSGSTAVWLWTGGLIALAIAAPHFLYPVFIMKALCMALFACAFNLLLGYVGLLSFGHAAFFGSASYITAHAVKVWGVPTELGILVNGLLVELEGEFADVTVTPATNQARIAPNAAPVAQ